MKLCAHLGYQFTEYPFLERFAAAATAGYTAVEFPSPYGFTVAQIKHQLDSHKLHLVQIGAPAGQPGSKDKGFAALLDRQEDFRDSLGVAIEYAQGLGCRHIHVMSGIASDASPGDWALYVRQVRTAVDVFAKHRIATLIEVLSNSAVPGYYMSDFSAAQRLFAAIPDPSLQFLFDTYHAAVLEGDVCTLLRQWLPRTGHIQIADWPGRHEPGTGTLPFDAIYQTLQDAQFAGWVGCEYHPQGTTQAGLHFLAPHLGKPPMPDSNAASIKGER